MKKKADLLGGWIRKGQSDMLAMTASLEAGALDACCFHAQQAAEKLLKAYLLHKDAEFPFTHNLVKLVQLAEQQDPKFASLRSAAERLTPYAVELRYDDEFWPSLDVAREACRLAGEVRDLILARLPHECAPPSQ
ncbi:MAG TPA: HEPN domain-containing protein [Phycisphaerae bacterium]|nr:HEPN domain-containing protein [Phycisphaerae bacterium]HUU59340.1 HEPN domain-containing protein [Phycisphaerae bacterium]